MTMLAVPSPPLDAWPAQLMATSAAAGGRPRATAAAAPEGGPRRPSARPAASGGDERGRLDPPREPGARVQQQRPQLAGPLPQAAQERDRQQREADRAGGDERPPRRPPGPRPPGQRRARPAAEALRLGGGPPRRRHAARAHGRLDDPRREHDQPQQADRRDQQQQPGRHGERAVVVPGQRAGGVAVLREGPPLERDTTLHGAAQRGDDGARVARVAARRPRGDPAVRVEDPERQEGVLDRRRHHHPHRARPDLDRALLGVAGGDPRRDEAGQEREGAAGPGRPRAHGRRGGPPARS